MPQRLLLLSLAVLGLLLGPAHAQSPSPNRYVTGPTHLRVDPVATDLVRRTTTVDVRWDASWRDAETWDAAWIVLKGRRADGAHVPLSIRSGPAVVANQSSDGAAPAFDVPVDRTGLFIHRAAPGEGDNRWRIRVPWSLSDGSDEGAVERVAALGVEMVYVPTGAFELGTVRSFSDRSVPTTRGSGTAPINALFRADPAGEDRFGGSYPVTSEAPIEIGPDRGQLYYIDAQITGVDTYSGDQTGTLAAGFPKGYQGFYQMKYEVTEQQYVAMLNRLSPDQARRRYDRSIRESGRPPAAYRHTIAFDDGRYRTRRPHRAASFLSWTDALAWADWMGLRPMTGLEFEKSARGPEAPSFREFVWGVSEIDAPEHYRVDRRLLDPDGTLAPTENGDERVDGNVHVLMLHYDSAADVCRPEGPNYRPGYYGCRTFEGGDGGRGPLRVGVHGVDSGGDRVAAGASHYGAMELGGNLHEQVVTLGHPQGRAFRGTHGDGRLTPTGGATNPDWRPDADEHVFAYRGGSWRAHENHARTADRFYGFERGGTDRSSTNGFRAVRTARSGAATISQPD